MRSAAGALVWLFTALTCIRCDAPDGYIINTPTGIAYKLVLQSQTWPVARDSCAQDGAALAVPNTLEEFMFIQKVVRAMHYPSIQNSEYKLIVWLGINNLDNYRIWRNIRGENIEKTGFHMWADGNGVGYSDAPEEPHCAGVAAVNWLREFWCHRRQPYICQFDIQITQ